MRKTWDIHGGVHPPENKHQSLGKPIAFAGIPETLVLPVSQHIGATAKPVVSVGDRVLKGQCIAAPEGFVSVPVHASSSGTVLALENRAVPHQSGLEDLCIVIETDGLDQWRSRESRDGINDLNPSELATIVRDAGIAGMGGAGFPTAVKLSPPPNIVISTLIINCTECEPYITSDHALLRERYEQLAEGIGVLSRILSPNEVIIGIEDNKPDIVDSIRASTARINFEQLTGKTVSCDVVTFPTKYPSGGEKQLIEILTGKQVPSGGLPSQLGIVCQNAGTTVAIADAVYRDQPLVSRITTLTGNALSQPCNYEVLLGTPIEYLLEKSGYNPAQGNRIIMGGPMMGFSLTSTHVPVVKTTNCILAPAESELPAPPPAQACIRCGLCAEACPVSLLPQQLYWFAKGKELEKLEQHNLADCIECGACSYVCPSHIPLVQYYRASKTEIRQREIDMRQAEQSKLRFDARQERLQRLEEEKIAARKARKARAAAKQKAAGTTASSGQSSADKDKAAKAAAIADALERVKKKKAEADKE